jgi:hypothetical protein
MTSRQQARARGPVRAPIQARDRQRVLAAHVQVAPLAAVAYPAMVIASTSANGSSSMSTRSLNVPGSDSSALQTT